MIRSIKLKITDNVELEAVIPFDRIVEINGDGICYLADQQFYVSESMIDKTVWEA